MNKKFDIERFKEGDTAIDDLKNYVYYLGTLPNGNIVYYTNKSWELKQASISLINSCWQMKPKEKWVYVDATLLYDSKEEAEAHKRFCDKHSVLVQITI